MEETGEAVGLTRERDCVDDGGGLGGGVEHLSELSLSLAQRIRAERANQAHKRTLTRNAHL